MAEALGVIGSLSAFSEILARSSTRSTRNPLVRNISNIIVSYKIQAALLSKVFEDGKLLSEDKFGITAALVRHLERSSHLLLKLDSLSSHLDASSWRERFGYVFKIQNIANNLEGESEKLGSILNLLLWDATKPVDLVERPLEERERGVYIVTRLLERSESRSTDIRGKDEELLPLERLSVEDFEKMTRKSKRTMPASQHWGVLVTRGDNIFEGTVFELLREREHSRPNMSAGTVLRQSVGGKPIWVYQSFQARTYLEDQDILSHAHEAIAYSGDKYHLIFRNCQVFPDSLILRIRIPSTRLGVFDGIMPGGINGIKIQYRHAPMILKRRCKEWKQWHEYTSGQNLPSLPAEATEVLQTFADIFLWMARAASVILSITSAFVLTKVDGQGWAFINAMLLAWALFYSDLRSIMYPLVNIRTRIGEMTAKQGGLLENMIDRINGMSMEVLEGDFTKIVDQVMGSRFSN